MNGDFHTNDDFYSSSNHTCTPQPEIYEFDTLVGVCDVETVDGYDRMNCYRLEFSSETGLLEPDKNGTQYRCGCNKLFPLGGEACRDPWQSGTVYYFCTVLFFVQFVFTLFLFWRTTSGFVVIMADKLKNGKKFDTVAATSLLLSLCSFFTSIMVASFVLRASGLVGDHTFNSLLFAFPFTVMFICQSFNGLALAWLDVAIKSDKVRERGEGRVKRTTHEANDTCRKHITNTSHTRRTHTSHSPTQTFLRLALLN